MYCIDREASLEERGTEAHRFNACSVLGLALAFFSGVRCRKSVYRQLQATGSLPRSGGLASRSPPCVNNPGLLPAPCSMGGTRRVA